MRTFGVPFSFVSSPETEKERILYAIMSVSTGFYPKHGFLICDKPITHYNSYSVVIPPEIAKVSRKFWRDAVKGGALMPKIISPRMSRELKNINFNPVEKSKVGKFETEWKKIEKSVWSAIGQMFPVEIKWIKNVEVRITNFGSMSSHFLLQKKKGQHLIIYLRSDADTKEIVNLLVLALIYPLEKDLGLSFTHRQTLRNFILTRPHFKKNYPKFTPKTFENPKIPLTLKRNSEKYIKFLGVPNIIDPIKIIRENMTLFGQKEEKILDNLIKKEGETLTYDEIADIIWGEGEFKSYWAINKLIQRINKKIKKLDVDFGIKGVRGRGYTTRSFKTL